MPHTPWHTVSEAYQTGSSDTTWKDVTEDLGIKVDPDYEQYLWEYDPYKEESIRAGAYGDIGGQYADARTQMMKTRQPSKAGGSFAGAGSSLLDMTTQDLYEDVGRGTRGTMLDMMTDITGERTGYKDDITQRLMDIQTMRGEEFDEFRRNIGTTRTNDFGETEYWLGNDWGSQSDWDEYQLKAEEQEYREEEAERDEFY